MELRRFIGMGAAIALASCGGEDGLVEVDPLEAPARSERQPRTEEARPRVDESETPHDRPGFKGPVPSTAVPVRTVVTLSFDDGRASQRVVPEILAPWGLCASFFVCSGRIGTDEYLDWSDLHALAVAGHEIGGHSRDHDFLPWLNDDEVRAAVCDERDELLAAGFTPVSFAYPKSGSDDRVAAIVESCGYLSARTNQGIGRPDGGGCSHCPAAETLPPPVPLQARSPRSITSDFTHADLKAYVLAAEEAGGWINFTFHDILDDCDGVDYCVRPSVLESFVSWLVERLDQGTVVRTQGEALHVAPAP